MHHHAMSHDEPLVLLSFAVAFFASYTALDMGTRLRRATGKARRLWLGGSAVVLGGGIWSMHFIAMLAVNVGVPVGYDFGLTALSLLIAIAIVAVGFHLVTLANPPIPRQIAAGCIVGCGVAIMHYTGMSALILPGTIHYDALLVAASILVAIVAATAALWLTLNLTSSWQRVAAAIVMAIAVCGMHYTAMLATSIAISTDQMTMVNPLSNAILAAAVSVSVFLILCLAMVCVFVDRRFEFLADREAESLRAANAALSATQGAIRNLLDNAEQGFLTIAPDLLVDDQSSAVCEAILGENPAGRPIVTLLCRRASQETQSTMRTTLTSVLRESSDYIRDLKLDLLPTMFELDGKSIKTSYKFLADSGRLMFILTDVTQTVLLTEAVERERKRLEMIVLAVTEGAAFATLVSSYRKFLADELPLLLERIDAPACADELRRRLHTYKGLLAQFSFPFSPLELHAFENTLLAQSEWTPAATREALAPEKLVSQLKLDLDGLADALGSDFVPSGQRTVLSQHQLQTMEQVAKDALAGADGRNVSPPLRQLLQTLADLGKLDVKAALVLHGRGASTLATRLEKQLAPVQIEGDDMGLPPELYNAFFGSLVHVFRNAVDHGIETPEERVLAGKPAEGTIRCSIRDSGDWLEILIQDDGRGVDRCMLEDKLAATGLEPHQIKNMSLEDLVFREGLSSRNTADEVSGRGMGLAAVKTELDRLGGTVSIETEQGVGTRFCFCLLTKPPACNDVILEKVAT